MSAATHLETFYVAQRFAMTTNRYEVQAPGPDGRPGETLAVAQQKRLAFREEVTFYADETRREMVFGFRARQRIDLNAGYDVVDAAQVPLGFFRKDFRASLIRSTFHVEGAGFAGTGQERSVPIALLRRFTDLPFLPIHFDFVTAEGRPLLSVERQSSVRDRYTVRVPDPRVDYRLAAALAVGLDALMQR